MLRKLVTQVQGLLRRRKIERETDEELRFHIEMETGANRARGLSPEEARRQALRDLGGIAQTRDAVRGVRTPWFDAVWQDLRYSLRGLARSPGYVVTTVLGLGVGLTSAIVMFSVLSTVYHGEPIGIDDRDSLARVTVAFVDDRGSRYSTSAAQFQAFRGPSSAIRDMSLMSVVKLTLRHAGEAVSVPGAVVSDTFFEVLGTRAAAGRLLTAVDDRPGADTAVLGFRTWQRWFAGSPDAIGQTILVGDRLMRIVGVAPDRFTGTGSWVVGGLGAC
jgi:hypothetical protein